jgi:hypothetical protein
MVESEKNIDIAKCNERLNQTHGICTNSHRIHILQSHQFAPFGLVLLLPSTDLATFCWPLTIGRVLLLTKLPLLCL